ncbi:MAG: hypothetical protein Q8942_16380 [Bacillota bacterium]|nr:hypothetical protein [Bacillota bacterium]
MKIGNKALLYKDWKYGKWFLPVITLELFLIFGLNLVQKNDFTIIGVGPQIQILLGPELFRYSAGLFLLTVTMLVMSSALFNYERKITTYTCATSMPFKRADIIKSKWLIGSYNIFFSFFIVYALMNTELILNFCWKDYFKYITYWFVIGVSLSLFIFGLMMLLQSLNGSVIIGSLLTVLFVGFPITLMFLFIAIMERNPCVSLAFGNGIDSVNSGFNIGNFIYRMFAFFTSISGIITLSLILLAITALFYIISKKIYVNNHLELTGRLTTVPSYERVIRVVIAYYTGFVLTLISSAILSNTRYFFRLDIVIALCLIVPAPLYLLNGKLIRIYNKRFE